MAFPPQAPSLIQNNAISQVLIQFYSNQIIPQMNLQSSTTQDLLPIKSNRLFFPFSSPSLLESPCHQSPQTPPKRRISPNSPCDPLNLHSANRSVDRSPDRESSPEADRYIPKRKLVKKQSMMSQQGYQAEAENKGCASEENGLAVSDLYRRFVLSESPKKKPAHSIVCFENSNILKFGSSSPLEETTPLLAGEGALGWTNTVELLSPTPRKINKMPVKVLDAPSLQDDYYLNLLDWGSQNFLSVGLSSCVYLWNAATAKVSKLCDLQDQNVTSVSWGLKNPHLAVGGQSGEVQVWDVNKMCKFRTFKGHTNRVGSLSWSSSLLSSGSRDKNILNRDLRDSREFISTFAGHKQQVCGLKWSPDEQMLCSGGNDNKLIVWSAKSAQPLIKYSDHQAAVKAVAWSPHQHGMLVSGGGTADRTIRFRNTLTSSTTKVVEAGSQVCCLMFSKVSHELVSTHGYQLNEINLWKSPTMAKVATLTGHSSRVLYLAMSPDGSSIVTGAGDETLRFWNLFTPKHKTVKSEGLLQSQNLFLR